MMVDKTGAQESIGKPALLLVDDERALLAAMEASLEREFEVETAASVEEADLRLGLRSYAMVICDHLMPGELGLDFLVRTKSRFPDMHRILLTGYMNPELISRSMKLAGLSACILKPVLPRELITEIKRVLAA